MSSNRVTSVAIRFYDGHEEEFGGITGAEVEAGFLYVQEGPDVMRAFAVNTIERFVVAHEHTN
jgi:hypothetical protein